MCLAGMFGTPPVPKPPPPPPPEPMQGAKTAVSGTERKNRSKQGPTGQSLVIPSPLNLP